MGQAMFQGLGDLPGGSFNTTPRGVSGDGSVVVGRAVSADSGEAFRWTEDEGIVGLGFLKLEKPLSAATSTSDDGSVIVGLAVSTESNPNTEPFVWTAEEGMFGLGDFPGGGTNGAATGVSADGTIVVGTSSAATGSQAFRWTAEERMVSIGGLLAPDFRSGAAGVSADGLVIVGGSRSEFGPEAFRWTAEEGMIGLGDLPGGDFDSRALAVSADGSVIVGVGESANGLEAFRWTAEEGMVGLGDLGEGMFRSGAAGVSADGSIIVGSSCSSPGPFCFDVEPFIWDGAHGMRSLRRVLIDVYRFDLTGWTLFQASGVSADGFTIVGHGRSPDGQTEGWIVRLPDCNGNGIADDLDILDQFSGDCNDNVIPDECDIADGSSTDCNANGVPDECAGEEFECCFRDECDFGELCDKGACLLDPCADQDGDGKITLCHIPPGNPENAHTLTVSERALPAHLTHGDHCGPCLDDEAASIVDFTKGALPDPACPGDFDADGAVGVPDLLMLLGAWGPNPGHPADFDGEVRVPELIILLGAWGGCP